MPLPTRHVVPANVARKYPPRKHGQQYAEHYYQLPGGSTSAPKKPQSYSSVDGANDNSDARSYQSSVDDEKNNPDLVHSREEAANRMLANMIRQIASLSVHAHSVFGKLGLCRFYFRFAVMFNETFHYDLKVLYCFDFRNIGSNDGQTDRKNQRLKSKSRSDFFEH